MLYMQLGKSRRKRPRWGLRILVGLVLLLVAVRLVLPYGIREYFNRQLLAAEGYAGTVGDVDLNLWRGAYELENVDIHKTRGKSHVPFFSADKVDLSVQWGELFRGSAVGEITIHAPKLNFVTGREDKDEEQTGPEWDWKEKLNELFPMRINRLAVENGEIHLRRFTGDPPFDIYLRDVQILATNLASSREMQEGNRASVSMRATPMTRGNFTLHAEVDPFAELPTFNLDFRLTDVALTDLNAFLRAYGNFDVEAGTFDMFGEVESNQGKFKGYVKPFFAEVEVVSWQEDLEEKGVLQTMWESAVGVAGDVLENPSTDEVATRVPIEGEVGDPEVGILPTIGNLLKNAFIQALIPGIEGALGNGGNGEKSG